MGETITRARPSAEVRSWRNAVFTIFGLSGFVFATWISRIPEVQQILHADYAQISLVIVGTSVGAIVGVVSSSHIVAHLGATRTILVFYLIASIGLLAAAVVIALAPSIPGIAACVALLGFGSSVTDVAMNLSGAANERALGRAIMPLFHAGFSLGTVLGGVVGSVTLALGVPPLVHLGGVGVLALVTTVVLVRFLQPAEVQADAATEAETSSFRSRLAVWKDRRIVLIGLVVLGMAFAEGSANDWLSLAMVKGHGLTQAEGAAVFSLFVAAMTAGRIAGVRLLDRFGRVPVLRGTAALAVVGLLLVITSPWVPLALVGVVLWGLGASLGFPVGMSAAADDPRTAAASVGAVATIGYAAFLVGPPVIGFAGQLTGRLLTALTIVLVLVGVAGLASGATREPARTR